MLYISVQVVFLILTIIYPAVIYVRTRFIIRIFTAPYLVQIHTQKYVPTPVTDQVILERGAIGQFREFESPRVHTRMNTWGHLLAHKLRVPTTQLAKMSIDLKFVKLTADVLEN